MDIDTAWQNLEAAIFDMESGQGDYEIKVATLYAAISMLMEYEPERIVDKVETSALPTRPTISWLVYECGRIKGLEASRGEELRKYWDKTAPEDKGVMEAPKGINLV